MIIERRRQQKEKKNIETRKKKEEEEARIENIHSYILLTFSNNYIDIRHEWYVKFRFHSKS
jgi:hypothetical protein